MRAALAHRRPDGAVPIWELGFHLWNSFSSRPVLLGREFEKLTAAEQDAALHANAEIMAAVAEELHFAAITVPGNYWEVGPGVPTYYWLPPEARLRQAELLARVAGDQILLVVHTGGVMYMPPPATYVEFSLKLFDAPEEIDLIARDTFHSGVEQARRFRDVGVEIMCSPSDIADNRGPFFSPLQMARFILPYLKKWADEVRALDAYSILHTDGNLYPILDDLAAAGLDALQAIDPVAGMDIRKVRTRIGNRLCLCGNIDCGLLVAGTPEDVYRVTCALLRDCKADGAFVLGASNAVQQEVPPANYRALVRAWKDCGSCSSPTG